MKPSSNLHKIRAAHVGVNYSNTSLLKARLQDEIIQLQRQLDALRTSDQAANFALVESYKEMIHSRRGMLSDLPR